MICGFLDHVCRTSVHFPVSFCKGLVTSIFRVINFQMQGPWGLALVPVLLGEAQRVLGVAARLELLLEDHDEVPVGLALLEGEVVQLLLPPLLRLLRLFFPHISKGY